MSEEVAERPLSWGPTAAGRFFTSPLKWVLSLEGDAFSLDVDGKQIREDARLLKQVAIKPGILWAKVRLDRLDGRSIELGAIPNARARRLKEAFDQRFQAISHQDFVAEQIRLFGVETTAQREACPQAALRGLLAVSRRARRTSRPAEIPCHAWCCANKKAPAL